MLPDESGLQIFSAFLSCNSLQEWSHTFAMGVRNLTESESPWVYRVDRIEDRFLTAGTRRMAPDELEKTITGSDVSQADSKQLSSGDTAIQKGPIPKIPGYRIVREVGRGAMGVVYEAIQENLNRHVALKMLSKVDEASHRERFQSEAEAAAQLHHPNIVQVHDVGEYDNRPFISLEYVDGETLDDQLDSVPVAPRLAAQTVETLARALDVAHKSGIVHRDVKPSNVMVARDGQLKVTDFGLAKNMAADSSQTRAGDILGTPHYMSPEQALGKLQEVGPASDIYSLGAILYELMTGCLPSQGETVLETLEKVRHEEPIAPRKLIPNLHRDLETICMKCLQKKARHRYESAEELADDLKRFLDSYPVQARPISMSEKFVRWVKRRPAVSSLIVVLILLVPLLVILEKQINKQSAITKELEQELDEAETQKIYELKTPKGLPPVPIPSNNLLTMAKVDLGKQLFFDKRLSVDNSVSCASCHDPQKGWSDGKPKSMGVRGQTVTRNSPTIVNASFSRVLFWDGRVMSMEEQAPQPITNSKEMGMPSLDAVARKINKIAGYRKIFNEVFGENATGENIGKAIAAFERTIMAGDTPFDCFQYGDKSAMSASARRGMNLFFNKAQCSSCHDGPNFTDDAFHNIGIGTHSAPPDLGRFLKSGLEGDRGAFKTPSLRDIARTGPYMHDGSMATLEEVIEHYNKGGDGNEHQDEDIFPLKLSEEEKQDLLTFLVEGLSSKDYPIVEAPALPR